jgi:hypothetical protein
MKLNTEKRCKKRLLEIKDKVSCKCGCFETYNSEKQYEEICKKCKSKINPYSNTIFKNIRFGIVKAFEIVQYYHSENYSVSSIKIAKKYGITQKTAYNFMMKVNSNKSFITKLLDKKESAKPVEWITTKQKLERNENEDKLRNYLFAKVNKS